MSFFPKVQTKIYSFLSNPSFTTYGMIGLTTVVLAALTVFDSASDNDGKAEDGYVSQLFNKSEDQQEQDQEQNQETGLVSSLTGGANKHRKKTKKHLKRLRKTHHKKS